MPVCDNGSEPKSDTPAFLRIDYNYLLSMMPVQYHWLQPFLPYLPPIIIDSAEFCAIDPPDPFDLTAEDLLAIISRSPLAIGTTALQKLLEFVQRAIWYEICQCSDLATPDPIGTPVEPVDAPVINPPGTTSPETEQPCLTRVINWVVDQFWSPSYWDSVFATPPQVSEYPMPNSYAEYTDAHVDIIPQGATHASSVNVRFDYYGPGASPIGQEILSFTDGQRRKLSPTTGTLRYQTLMLFSQSQSITDSATVTIRHYCSVSGPGSVNSGCCPPDPQIAIMLAEVRELVTLIQRQQVPFAYVYGVLHTGLTGNGNVPCQGVLGIHTHASTIPTYVGSVDGEPVTHFELGWIRFEYADGHADRIFIDAEDRVYFPHAAGAIVGVSYSLSPGVVIDIRELEREP